MTEMRIWVESTEVEGGRREDELQYFFFFFQLVMIVAASTTDLSAVVAGEAVEVIVVKDVKSKSRPATSTATAQPKVLQSTYQERHGLNNVCAEQVRCNYINCACALRKIVLRLSQDPLFPREKWIQEVSSNDLKIICTVEGSQYYDE